MKMSYPLKSSNFEERKRNARKKIWSTVLVLIIILIILATTVAKTTLFFIAKPIWVVENYILSASGNTVKLFKSKQSLIDENQALQNKLFADGSLSAMNTILQKENDNLKDLLGRKVTKDKSILATILVKPPQNLYDILTIDAGTDQGVKVGDKVIADANVYIGEVREVYSNSAKVVLYSAPGEKRQVVQPMRLVSLRCGITGSRRYRIHQPFSCQKDRRGQPVPWWYRAWKARGPFSLKFSHWPVQPISGCPRQQG